MACRLHGAVPLTEFSGLIEKLVVPQLIKKFLPSLYGLLHSDFPTKTLYSLLLSPCVPHALPFLSSLI